MSRLNSRKIELLLLGAALAAMIVCSACQRSRGFKQDQEYYKPENQSYYSRAGGKGLAQKVEQLGQPKKRIIIFDFWNDTPVKQGDLGLFASDELRRGLYASQRVILPADIKSDMTTEDFIEGDRVRVAQLIREGRRLGVALLAIGRISKVVFRQKGDEVGLFRQSQSIAVVEVEIKLFDVSTGREIMAIGKSGDASSSTTVAMEGSNVQSPEFRAELSKLAVRNAMAQAVPDVVKSIEKMTWEGHVAKVVGAKIYVNAGRTSGLIIGDILKVMTPGDDVYDLSTGAYLGRSKGQLKGTLEVVDFIGSDGAVAEVHTGGNIQEGDTVQLY